MHPLTMSLLKRPPSLFISSLSSIPPRITLSCAGVRTIRTIAPPPTTSIANNSNITNSITPRAMDTWVVPRRSKNGERAPVCRSSVPTARFGAAAAAEKNSGERRDLAAGEVGSEDPNWRNPDDSEGGRVGEDRVAERLLTLPTVLTMGRVGAVPLLVTTFYMNSWWATTATTSIFIVAAITDWLDGYIARKMRLGTAFGAFLDPVADKLMVAATLVLLCTRPLEIAVFGQVPWLLTVPSIAIIGREITMSAVREWAASQDSKVLEAVAVNNLGKWKTATQMTALTILLATRDSSLCGPGVLAASGVVLLYVSAGLTVWSLVIYMSKVWRLILK
ncbi:hypothetical protein AAC387_Pa03g2711 [Persea americana]